MVPVLYSATARTCLRGLGLGNKNSEFMRFPRQTPTCVDPASEMRLGYFLKSHQV